MSDDRLWLGLCVALLAAMAIWLLYPSGSGAKKLKVSFHDVKIPEALKNHTKEFDSPEILEVTDGIYVALGYALANVIILEGPDGLIIVDVTESVESGAEVYKALRQITNKPIKAIVYTHSHVDHIMGAEAFIENKTAIPEIWAHHTIMKDIDRDINTIGYIIVKRAMRQFGVLLKDGHENSGIGLTLKATESHTASLIKPNNFLFGEEKHIILAGLQITLIHIPGETSNQIGVWVPEKRALLCADDLYRTFPNLYAIRGTSNRDLPDWYASLDKMRKLRPEFLVPSHTRPVVGEKEVVEVLTIYRDAIQFVHDQTVRFMNKGFTPDQIVDMVVFPASLQGHPFLLQFYGTVAWSVRGVFNSYMGWFSGDPADLSPLPPTEKAKRMVSMAGGLDALLAIAQKALEDGDWQWSLELATTALVLQPNLVRARTLKIDALKMAAGEQTSANGRNYYLTTALEEALQVDTTVTDVKRFRTMRKMSVFELFSAMGKRFKSEDCSQENTTVLFVFEDVNEQVCVNIRNGIAEITARDLCGSVAITVTTRYKVWLDMATKELTPLEAYSNGDMTIDGGMFAFRSFMDCFERD